MLDPTKVEAEMSSGCKPALCDTKICPELAATPTSWKAWPRHAQIRRRHWRRRRRRRIGLISKARDGGAPSSTVSASQTDRKHSSPPSYRQPASLGPPIHQARDRSAAQRPRCREGSPSPLATTMANDWRRENSFRQTIW